MKTERLPGDIKALTIEVMWMLGKVVTPQILEKNKTEKKMVLSYILKPT